MGDATPNLIEVEPLSLEDRYLGALFGLAAGDALGTTLEFESPGTFAPLTDMIGGGPFNLAPGQWTDDTSMALCLADSLVHRSSNDPKDQIERYVAWWKHGRLSSTGDCFDIGNATRESLARFVRTGEPLAGSTDPKSAGNGSLMRVAPIPMAFRANIESAVNAAALSSRVTHAAQEPVDACRLMTVLMIHALNGAGKAEVLRGDLWERSVHGPTPRLAPKVRAIAQGSYKRKSPPAIRGAGYVIDSLEAALWAFDAQEGFEQAVLAAANLGDDADTTAAVCGQLAGAFYGLSGIPGRWIQKLAMRDTIAELARGLLALSRSLGA